jgi:hypothetical protein
MKKILRWFILICIAGIIGFASGWLIIEPKILTMKQTMLLSTGKPLTEYKHTIREVIYDVDIDSDGKYDATFKYVRSNR